MLQANESGFFPYTPATNLLYGLRESAGDARRRGPGKRLSPHARHAEATRAAARAWGLPINCADDASIPRR